MFSLWAGHERTRIAAQRVSEEFHGAEQMLQWLTRRAALYQCAQGFEFTIAEGTVELEVQIHSTLAENVRQKVLNVESRALHAVLAKVIGRGLDDFEHGLHCVESAFTRARNRGQ